MTSESGEQIAARFRCESRSEGMIEGTRESLARCVLMLNTYAPDIYPAGPGGQVHFARAIMDSVAEEIRAFLLNEDATNVFLKSLLNPEENGQAVPPHIRDAARRVLGMPAVEGY